MPSTSMPIQFPLPAETTLTSALTELFPRLHAALVPAEETAKKERFVTTLRIASFATYTFTIEGPAVTVDEREDLHPDAWANVPADLAEWFLADWKGAGRFRPAAPGGAAGAHGFVLLTDPRILRRIALVPSIVELVLNDGPGGRPARVLTATGLHAKKGVDPDARPDVTLEASTTTLERLARAEMAPEEALAGEVAVRGKRLVAMQLALALAPFFPLPRR